MIENRNRNDQETKEFETDPGIAKGGNKEISENDDEDILQNDTDAPEMDDLEDLDLDADMEEDDDLDEDTSEENEV